MVSPLGEKGYRNTSENQQEAHQEQLLHSVRGMNNSRQFDCWEFLSFINKTSNIVSRADAMMTAIVRNGIVFATSSVQRNLFVLITPTSNSTVIKMRRHSQNHVK